MKNLSDHTVLPCEFLISLLIRGIRVVKHAIWASSLYFLYLLHFFVFPIPASLSISKILASSQPTYDPLHGHIGLILIFLVDPLCDGASVHRPAWLEVCLFHYCSFCHIHREYCRFTVLSGTSGRQKMVSKHSQIILCIGFHGLGLLQIKLSPPPLFISKFQVCACIITIFIKHFSCYHPLTKPGLRYLYSCSYTDIGCTVIEVSSF
jgi:hypothetical protein